MAVRSSSFKKVRVIRKSVFIRAMFAKALVYENVYRVLPINHTTAELWMHFLHVRALVYCDFEQGLL